MQPLKLQVTPDEIAVITRVLRRAKSMKAWARAQSIDLILGPCIPMAVLERGDDLHFAIANGWEVEGGSTVWIETEEVDGVSDREPEL